MTTRTKPMRVLVLGLSRTGTTSLLHALEKLGYKTYHMHENVKNPAFFTFWKAAILAKFQSNPSSPTPSNPPNFDQILAPYDAVSDVPAILFAPELLQTYPDAKVILTTRDTEKWVTSMQSSIWLVHSWRTWDTLAKFNPGLIHGWRTCDTMDWDAFINSTPKKPSLLPPRRDYLSAEYRDLARKQFEEHNRHIKEMVPAANLLEFQPVDGWGPLCAFLGHDVPDGPYPRTWDKDELVRYATMLWFLGAFMLVVKLASPVVFAVVCRWVGRRYGFW